MIGLLMGTTAAAQEFLTNAGSAVVIDHNTGQTLLAKNADVPLPPASMSKLMTLYMTFEALEDGRLALDTVLPVSEEVRHWFASPRSAVGFLAHAASLPMEEIGPHASPTGPACRRRWARRSRRCDAWWARTPPG